MGEAGQLTGYHPDYLGFLARVGKLNATKIGRNWVTSKEALASLTGDSESAQYKEEGEEVTRSFDGIHERTVEVNHQLSNLKSKVITDLVRRTTVETIAQTMEAPTGEERLAKLHSRYKKDIERMFDSKLASLGLLASTETPHHIKPANIYERTSPTLMINPVSLSNTQRSYGLDRGLQQSGVNLSKIHKSFEHRFDTAKYLWFVLVVITLILSVTVIYTYTSTQDKLNQIESSLQQISDR
jgi:hypothetical protein